ncbi:tetratricopeptide repeat protein 28-like isoform X2 [Nematostella vectensis]|uniref:tetratricopeptide repeat protein 28-like isoform X2 n=1 Tax=Nematostella vectensis TaxID=45351 RepID=UPI0020772E20|nr:tetratricopeptide repeat protein 28-like isoform X2 [Nematostella vectensis]
MENFRHALSLCQKTGDESGQGNAYLDMGRVHRSHAKYEDAMNNYQHALSLFQKTGDESGQAKAYLGMGFVHISQGKYEDAMNNYQLALSLFQKTGDESCQANAYLGMGVVYSSQGKYEDAMNNYQHALSLFQKTGDESGQANAYLGMGDMHMSQDKYEDSMNNYQLALSLFQTTGDESGQANAYLGMGDMHMSQGKYEDAMNSYQHGLSLFQKTGDESGQANAYRGMGNVHMFQAKYEDAMNNYQHALSLFLKTGDVSGQAYAYYGIGNVYRFQGKYEDAMNNYQHALSLFQKTGDESGQANAYRGMGNVHMFQAKYEDAMNNYQRALSLLQKRGDESGLIKNTYLCMGNVYRFQGKYEDALNIYQHALSLFQKAGDESGQANAYLGMGNVHRSQSKDEDALNNYQHALSLFQKAGDQEGQVNTYRAMANIFGVICKYEEEKKCIRQAISIAATSENVQPNLEERGRLYTKSGDFNEANKCYEKQLDLCLMNGDVVGQAHTHVMMGTLHMSQRNYDKAMECYQQARDKYEKSGSTYSQNMQAILYLRMAEVHFIRLNYKEALEYFLLAEYYSPKTSTRLLSNIYQGIGKLYVCMGQFEDAESYLFKSLIFYEQIFTNLGKLEDAKTNIVDTYIEAYHWLVFVSVKLGKKSQAVLVSEQGRSRVLSENLQTKYGLQGDATKNSLGQEVCLLVSGTSPSFVVVSLSDKYLHLFTLSSLTPLVVHPAAMQMTDKAEQWLSLLKYLINRVICDANLHVRQNRDDTFEDRSLDLDYDDESEQQHVLTELARVTLGSKGSEKTNEIGGESSGNRKDKSGLTSPLPHTTGKPKASDEGTSGKVPQEHEENVCSPPPIGSAETQRGSGLLKELYRILIEPIEKELTQVEVVFVPEGVTFMVPFGALQSPDGRFLAEKKAIRFGPSLTTLKLLRECPEDKHFKRGVLVVANPRSNANVFTRRNGADVVKSFHKRFANLPAASKEAIKIREILPDVTCLIEYQATKNAVMQSLKKGVGVIHIASHGDSQTGEILVAPEPRMDKHDIAEKEEYLLTMKEISSCQINASLVVLSCCHSGRGQIRAEGVMGLARAFLAAGARSVLATLWTIGDNATLEFMERFYRHLASGLSTSASLKRTIRDTISMNDKYSHPYYWGAFVLVGDDVTIR